MNIKDLAGDSPELLAESRKRPTTRSTAQQKAIADEQQVAPAPQQTMLICSLVGGLALMVIAHRPAGHLLHPQGGGPRLQDEAAARAGGRREA